MFVNPSTIESAIKTEIEALVSTPVQVFPDDPRLFVEREMTSAVGNVVVSMPDASRRDETEAGYTFGYKPQVSVIKPGLHGDEGHTGVYDDVTAIANGLQDKRLIIDGDPYKMTVDRVRFRNYHAQGVWEYVILTSLVPYLSRTRQPVI